MCPGLHGVGLLDFWSRRPSKEPCPCPSVIPKSSAARCSIWWPLAALSRRSLPIWVSHGDRGLVCLTDRFISYGGHDELPRIPPTRVLVQ